MIKDLAKDWIKDNKNKVVKAVEKATGRKMIPGKDSINVDIVHRENTTDKTEFYYAAVVFAGDVYGFLEVDYSEPCLVFIPSSKLRGIWQD